MEHDAVTFRSRFPALAAPCAAKATEMGASESRLLKANRHAKIFRHSFSEVTGAELRSVIEKRTSLRAEWYFYNSVQDLQLAASAPFWPRVVSLHDAGGDPFPDYRYCFLIEDIPHSSLEDLIAKGAFSFAERLAEISSLPPSCIEARRVTANSLPISIFHRFCERAHALGHLCETDKSRSIERLRDNWGVISSPLFGKSFTVPSHNDVGLLNITRRQGGGDFVFIDWEQVAFNDIGADLHHFICSGSESPRAIDFATNLHDIYCDIMSKRHGVTAQAVSANAYSYALLRSLLRSNAPEKNNFQFDRVVALSQHLIDLAYRR